MAGKKGEDSKQGLIIGLVFMFLLVIGLGVATYYGFADQQRLTDAANKAKKEEKDAKEARNWERYQNLLLKAYVGHTLNTEDQEALNSLQGQYENSQLGKDEKNKPDFDALVKKLAADPSAGGLGWDASAKKPRTNFFAQFEDMKTSTAQSAQKLAAAEKKFAKEMTAKDDQMKAAEKERDDWKTASAKLKEEVGQLTKKHSAEFSANLTALEKLSNDLEDFKKKMDRKDDETKKTAEKLNQDIRNQKTQISRLNDQIKPVNVVDYDQSKGKILSVERSAQVAYVNLGSSDHVKPQLTFSIYGAGASLRNNAQRKGSLEITKVIGPHISQARITDVTDGNRDPILTGDALFNPVWSSNLRQHVAVAGLIDLTGDGHDNTPEFLRTLREQGIVVDAYMDLKDLTIKGDGLSLKTQYLVVGDQPEFGADFSGSDVRTERKTKMIDEMGKMQKEATQMGITIIPYRRFLVLIGYPMPRVLTTRPGTNYLESPRLGSGMERKEPAKEGEKGKGDKAKEKDADKGAKEK